MEKVPAAGYKIVGLPVVGFRRKISFALLKAVFKAYRSMRMARRIIRDFKPDVAVGVGGYASGPALKAAAGLKVPYLLQEQNSYPGITNKMLAAKAGKICVAYDNMDRFFPKEKIIKTGNPVRQDIRGIVNKSSKAFDKFGLDPQKPVLLVVGGSLGARTINESVAARLADFPKNNIGLIWQTGKNYFPAAKELVDRLKPANVFVSDFIYDMDLAFSAADIIVSRAGAGTISELCIVGKPVILVPSPNVAEDHQTKNARALSDVDAAVLITDADARNVLIDNALDLFKDADRCHRLSVNIKKLELPDAANVIADEVYALL